MTSLVIDLRSNPGGLVTGVCDTLRQILPKGVIVYTEDKYKNREEQKCDGKNPIDIPLAVLVNKSSASASEIFAGAVKDYGIGTVVGTVTYGKGVVQDTYQLKEGGALKLTVSHYFTPKGNNINGKGISPDVSVDLPENSSEDVQLDKALEVLKGSEEGIIR
jgi:carboxyl-terminal processing protease